MLLLSSLSSLTCFLAPPKMSAAKIPDFHFVSDSWFAALIGEPIFNDPSGPPERGWVMRVSSGLLVVLSVARFLAYASPAYPQGSTAVAQLNGTVLDESGGTVKGATVALRHTDTNRSYTTSSNDSGYYAVV